MIFVTLARILFFMCYAGETPNIEYYSDHLLDSEDLFGKDNKAIDKLKREKYKSVYKDK